MPDRHDASDEVFESVVAATDKYYEAKRGRSYSDEKVDRWLERWFFRFVELPEHAKVLDLCCGDGCWSMGLLRRRPDLRITGVDISGSAVDLATGRASEVKAPVSPRFFAFDCAQPLPLDGPFDAIFARGVFVFNQHEMTRPGTLALLQQWHDLLAPGGRFVAMYGSRPERLGTYTAPEQTAGLPLNLLPRRDEVLDFSGGKYNHTVASFAAPFELMERAVLDFYEFRRGRHTLITLRVS